MLLVTRTTSADSAVPVAGDRTVPAGLQDVLPGALSAVLSRARPSPSPPLRRDRSPGTAQRFRPGSGAGRGQRPGGGREYCAVKMALPVSVRAGAAVRDLALRSARLRGSFPVSEPWPPRPAEEEASVEAALLPVPLSAAGRP